MQILYSNIFPLSIEDNQQTIFDCFQSQISNCDSIDIAVGYVSKAALEEIDRLLTEYNISRISLLMGMYYVEGMAESAYRVAIALNDKWMREGKGEIRLSRAFKFHGKIYVFHKGGEPRSAILGSANLGVIKPEANNIRQYEVASLLTDSLEVQEVFALIQKLQSNRCSINIVNATDIKLIREVNMSLTGVDTVEQVPQTEVALFQRHLTDVTFRLPIKVPAFSERFMDDGKHYIKSNLNVSYAAPRSARKSRDWYETQFTVNKSITQLPGYPEKNVPFFVVTDDGYVFKAHTTSDGNKQFSAVGDELILGRWIKGRLVAAGLVTPVNDTQKDTEHLGMITKEMLASYGCDTLVMTKTDQKLEDEDGNLLDVWYLSFEAGADEEETE